MGRFRIDSFRVQNKGNLLAFFNVTDLDTGLEYRDLRFLSGTRGKFIGFPSRQYEKDGEQKYSDYVRIADKGQNPLGRDWVDELVETCDAELEKNGTATPAPVRSGRGAVGGKSGKKLPF